MPLEASPGHEGSCVVGWHTERRALLRDRQPNDRHQHTDLQRVPDPADLGVEVVRRVIAYLKNRRVLYDPLDLEVPRHCVTSVMEIRQFLTDLIGTGGIAKELEASFRAMRAACHKFLEDLGPLNARLHSWQAHRWHGGYGGLDDYLLNQALGALPGVFGIHVGQLAVRYGIDVEDRLASILPAADEEP